MTGWAMNNDAVVYPSYLRYQWAAWFNNIDPGDDAGSNGPTFSSVADSMTDVDTLMQRASSEHGGSPYATVTAYDPTEELEGIDERLVKFDEEVDAFDPDEILDKAFKYAYDYTDAHIVDSDNIDAVVSASEARSKADFLQRVSRVACGLWDAGAAFNTQFYQTLGNMEMERANQVADLDAKLRLATFNDRSRIILGVAESYLSAHSRKLEAYRASTQMNMEAAKFSIVAKGDQIGEDLKYEEQDAMWDLNLLQHGVMMMGALNGAPNFPRASTPRERLLASISTSFSAGTQVALGTGGNIPLGVGAFAASLAGQLWGLGS